MATLYLPEAVLLHARGAFLDSNLLTDLISSPFEAIFSPHIQTKHEKRLFNANCSIQLALFETFCSISVRTF